MAVLKVKVNGEWQEIPAIVGPAGPQGIPGAQGDPGEQGIQGEAGKGIFSFQKTGTSGLTDTYRMTYTDGSWIDMQISNGKGIRTIAKTGTSENVDTYTITFNDNTTMTFTVTNANIDDTAGAGVTNKTWSANKLSQQSAEVDELKRDLKTKVDVSYNTITNQEVASFDDGAEDLAVGGLVIAIDEPTQEGSGDPSPTNVRPINGYTGLTIYKSGADTSDPTTTPVSWADEAGMVYSGYVDVIAGKLTVDKIGKVADGTTSFTQYSNAFYTENFFPAGYTKLTKVNEGFLCNKYKVIDNIGSASQVSGKEDKTIFNQYGYTRRLFIKDTSISTITALQESLNSVPLVVVFPLITPVTYDITPVDLYTTKGTNNIWANTGNIISLKYPVDPELRFDQIDEEIEQINEQIDQFPTLPKRFNNTLDNGLPEYSANTNAVCTHEFIPCKKGDIVEFVPVRPNIDGYIYKFGYKTYDSNGNVVTSEGNVQTYLYKTKINTDAVASIRFFVVEMQGNTNNPLRENTYGYTPYTLVYKSDSFYAQAETYPDKYNDLLSQARFSPVAGAKKITLMHFSDIHTDFNAMVKAVETGEKYKAKVDAMLHTGDISNQNWNDGLNNWVESGCAAKVLNTVGNHESYVNSSFGAADKTAVYAALFAPYISNFGVVQPTGVNDSSSPYYCACYYYKDFANESIRLIVLDTSYWDDYEKTWLADVLSDALTNGYHVILACHSPRYITGIVEANFCSYTSPNINNYQNNVANFTEGWLDPVDDFIDNGGNLICMLCGHNHRDHIGYLRDYPNILCITADTPSRAVSQDSARVVHEINDTAFNMITFNTTEKLIKIVRIGAEVDGHMRPKHVFCYDYGNKTIVSQW